MATNTNYTQTILDSIDIMVERAVTTAKFDKTVAASIVTCMDAATGKYKVKYQDGTYQATADNIENQYSDGAEVYLLVPQGDFTKPKKILGEISSSTTSDTTTTEEAIVSFDEVGSNVVKMKVDSIGISSRKCGVQNKGIKTLYNNDGSAIDKTTLEIDNASLQKSAAEDGCSFFSVSAEFKTTLADCQREKGAYMLLITLVYTDENDKEQKQTYKLDINAMSGNPYLYSTWTQQKTMFNLPVGTFKRVESIVFLAEDFPNQLTDEAENDIFVRNIQLVGMASVASPYFNTYYIKINGTKGLCLGEDNPTTVLSPQVSYRDRKVDLTNANIYWFRENSNVTSSHSQYLQHGGRGWACLNPSSKVTSETKGEDGKNVLMTMFSSKATHTVTRSSNYAPAEARYKCVIVLSTGVMIEKIFLITDENYNQKVQITSSNGTEFKNGNKATTLTCKLLRPDSKDWTPPSGRSIRYYWHSESKSGEIENLYYYTNGNSTVQNIVDTWDTVRKSSSFTNYQIHNCATSLKTAINDMLELDIISETKKFGKFNDIEEGSVDAEIKAAFDKIIASDNNVYNDYVKGQLEKITNKTLTSCQYKTVLNAIDTYNTKYYFTYIHRNKFYELPARVISGSVTYVCTVWMTDADNKYTVYLGSSKIKLTNTIENQANKNTGTAVIVNGDQVFKYDAEGRSPLVSTTKNPNPEGIKALKFNVFDAQGSQIDDAKIDEKKDSDTVISSWAWYVPGDNTLIEIDSSYKTEANKQSDGTYRIANVKELPFTIAASYNDKLTQNKIRLRVKYEGNYINVYTNFAFVKDGSNGTNGTEYFCKVSPNTNTLKEWPALIVRNNSIQLNYSPATTNQWFKADLFRNNEKVSQSNASVSWKLLKNEYQTSSGGYAKTASHFTISEDGICKTIDQSAIQGTNNPSNIVQAEFSYSPETNSTTDATKRADTKVYGSLPLSTVIMYGNNDYIARIKPNSGFNTVTYDDGGQNPSFPNQKFEVQVFKKDESGAFDYNDNLANITGKNNASGTPMRCKFSIYGHNKTLLSISNWKDTASNINVKGMSKENIKKVLPNNTCTVKAKNGYSGFETNCGLRVDIYKYNKNNSNPSYSASDLIATIFHPIQLIINKYGHPALNNWNGNGIEINDGEGIILSPQMGAGYKEANNSFTGILMGSVRKNLTDETGLMGYKGGVRTIFLDAETGKAEFGVAGKGQIQLYPGDYDTANGTFSDVSAVIKGGNYVDKATGGTGMQIDLTTPEIRFGSRNFIVDKTGIVTMKGASIKNGNIEMSGGYLQLKGGTNAEVTIDPANILGSNKTFYIKNNKAEVVFSVNKNTGVTTIGTEGQGWEVTPHRMMAVKDNVYTLIQGAGKSNSFVAGAAGLKDEDILDAPFRVTRTGSLYAKKGTIGGWNIGAESLYIQQKDGDTVKSHTALKTTGDYAFVINSPSTASYMEAPFKISHAGRVTINDTTAYKKDEEYGDTLLFQVVNCTKKSGESVYSTKLGTYIAPNRIYMKDMLSGGEYTGGSIYYEGSNSNTVGSTGGGNYFYFTRPIMLPNSLYNSSANTGDGEWSGGAICVKGHYGVPIIMQSFMRNYEMITAKWYGYVLAFGPRAEDSRDDNSIRQTILRGKNVHLMAYGNDNNSNKLYQGYITFNAANVWSRVAVTTKSSDERIKNLYELDEAYYTFFKKLKPLAYTWKNQNDSCIHIGYGAQSVKQALTDSGLDWQKTDFVRCMKADDENRIKEDYGLNELYTVSYDSLATLSTAVLHKTVNEMDILQQEVKNLKDVVKLQQEQIQMLLSKLD